MTLHAAIEKLLQQTGRSMTTQQIADELNKNGWYIKRDKSAITSFQIHGRTKNYPELFSRDGSIVFLQSRSQLKKVKLKPVSNSTIKRTSSAKDNDEQYILDLCDTVLGLVSLRQHKFDFLVGDIGKNGRCRKLPVDGYYQKLKLVIEYCERQHTESIVHFDKPGKLTISGVHRGEQRKIYDERRRQLLPKHNIKLIELSYFDFNYNRQKRIIRDPEFDIKIVKKKLKNFV